MALPNLELHAAFSFTVELDGINNAYFSECTLPTLEVDVLERKEGGYNTGVHLLPGPVKAGRITLKRGVVKSNQLLKWYCDVASGQLKNARRKVSVVMRDSLLAEVMRFNFGQAYPTKWTGPTFKTADSALAIETLELAFADLEVVIAG